MFWIVVDVISVWLYFVKGVVFLSLLYVILLALAVAGLVGWARHAAVAQPGARTDGAERIAA